VVVLMNVTGSAWPGGRFTYPVISARTFPVIADTVSLLRLVP
jgi:hypothetical protein